MSNPFRAVAEMATALQTVEVAGQTFQFSGDGVSVEQKFAVLFPDPIEQGRLADHLSAALGCTVPEGIVTAARAIQVAFVTEEGANPPDIADIVRMAISQPASFTHLDMAASQVLGLTTPTKTAGGIADWGQVYSLLRKAHKKGGDQDLVKQAALIAKAALQGAGENPEPLDADTEPTLEALRGNSDAASSDGS
jgi:hypothetical protein